MKAVHFRRFGGSGVLEYGELPDPLLGPDHVLVRMRAASLNPIDWKAREGLLAPVMDTVFPVVTGFDVAGVVERTGPAVTEYAPGDEVMGFVWPDRLGHGTFADLVAAPVRTLAPKTPGLTWAEAAAIPLAGLAAYQSLVHRLRVTGADTVLVHAAAGGVGIFAVQIAVTLGARVIGTASEDNHDFLRALGAEPVTYRKALAEGVRALAPGGVTAVLDAAGKRALRVSPELLAPGGRLVSVADPQVRALGGTYVFTRPSTSDLTELGRMAGDGRLRVEIARSFPLEKAAEAHDLIRAGHTRGKLVVTAS
ncbi:NADP-dependent oxidoreductase [Streptomyces longisporoflavus]|uniref:NADP-dependent oxidoreductase n=1 Tax=Streptomyces longisporoflavus TaxID=28044 RepID=A0ABW7QVH1_9ACTN